VQSPDELYARAVPPPELPETGHFVEEAVGEGKFYDAREAEAAEAPVDPSPFAPEPEEDILALFDPRWVDEMEGLLFVGRVTHEFTLARHKITIATPDASESLKVALLIKDYQDTAGALRALTIAAVATCLVKVDNHEVPRGIMADGSDDLEVRFDWVSKLHTTMIDGIYREYEDLEVKVAEAIQSLGKAGAPLAPSIPG
jgi:hypothetical protein